MELSLRRTQQLLHKTNRSIVSTLLYHEIFDFPLKKDELVKWRAGFGKTSHKSREIKVKAGYCFFAGQEKLVLQRKLREKYSKEKMKIAERAANHLKKIPTVKMVGVTGSLAMMNAKDESDIDLMVVTSRNCLWMTRLASIILLKLYGMKLRKASVRDEKDMVCLNIWMDEKDLKINKRNAYTAHEIAQIVPLINKKKTYESLLWENGWILKFWPNAVGIQKLKEKLGNTKSKPFIFEKLAFKVQYLFMKNKITRETVTPTRAFFHPFDWGEVVKRRGFGV